MESTLAITLVLLGMLAVVLASGIWISIGLAGIGILTIHFFLPPGMFRMLPMIQFNILNDFILAAIPLFIFMGSIIYQGKIAEKIYSGLSKWIGLLPGGLIQTNILACAIFGAVSGSSLAGAATMGTVAIDELRERGYNRRLIYGSLASGGTLATMIPPSILFILYGAFGGVSVGKLFIAGIVPGCILVFSYMFYIGMVALRNPTYTPAVERVSFIEIVISLKSLLPPIGLIVAVLGSIYTGIATPTESAAVGSVAAVFILIIEKRFSWDTLRKASHMAVHTTCMVALMTVGAYIISMGISMLKIPAAVSLWVASLEFSPWAIALMVSFIYILLGCVIEGTSMFFLTFPVIYPMMMKLGFDPIWFGVMMAIFIEISLITPPVGLNLFIIHQISGEDSMEDTVKGAFPFFVCLFIVMLIFIFFPAIITFLPDKLG